MQETVLSTSGISADTNADGVQINLVPKEGANIFSGAANGLYSGSSMQSDNLTDELLARGLTTVTHVRYVFDSGATLGGPIKKDKLWFYFSYRQWGNERQAAGKFFNATQGTPFYTADTGRPAYVHEWYESKGTRVTWRASERNKFNFFADPQRDCHCPANVASGNVNAPEAFFSYKLTPAGLYQASWNYPRTNRLLFEAGVGMVYGSWPTYSEPIFGVDPTDIAITDSTLGITYNAPVAGSINPTKDVPRWSQRGTMSYVTGTHAFKTGFQLEEMVQDVSTIVSGGQNVAYTFNNRVPTSITQWATPYLQRANNKDFGFYAQDQWTVKRLTLNYGLRYDMFKGLIPAQHVDATPWVPARDYAQVNNVPSWKDWNPRGGVAWDVTGDGKTAVKVAMGRYVTKGSTTFTLGLNPITTSINTVNRTWNDTNGNYVPDCDLGNFGVNGECGALNNTNFGGRNPTINYSDDVLHGTSKRGYNWDFTTEVQRQLRTGVSMTAGYYRNWYGNFFTTDNSLVTPSDFSSYCVTAPTDSRLPGGGGYPICGLYDVNPNKFGQSNSIVSQASTFGKITQQNDFIAVSVTARLGAKTQLGGGVDTGRTVNDYCFNVDSPGAAAAGTVVGLPSIAANPVPFTATTINGQAICRIVTPFEGQTQVKGFGSYNLPKDFFVSIIYQNVSGPPVTSTYAAPNSVIAPSLGRSLAACGTRNPCTNTALVPLIVPQSQFEDRYTRLDLRLSKRFQLTQRVRLTGNFNMYNLFNSSAIQIENVNYGSLWLQPSLIEDGRMVQVSANLNF